MQIIEKNTCPVDYHVSAVVYSYKMCKMITVPRCTYLAAVGSMSMSFFWVTYGCRKEEHFSIHFSQITSSQTIWTNWKALIISLCMWCFQYIETRIETAIESHYSM